MAIIDLLEIVEEKEKKPSINKEVLRYFSQQKNVPLSIQKQVADYLAKNAQYLEMNQLYVQPWLYPILLGVVGSKFLSEKGQAPVIPEPLKSPGTLRRFIVVAIENFNKMDKTNIPETFVVGMILCFIMSNLPIYQCSASAVQVGSLGMLQFNNLDEVKYFTQMFERIFSQFVGFNFNAKWEALPRISDITQRGLFPLPRVIPMDELSHELSQTPNETFFYPPSEEGGCCVLQ